MKYKDQCDNCGKFAILKGINGKCLCDECSSNPYLEQNFVIENNDNSDNNLWPKNNPAFEKQLTIFDLFDLDGGKV